MQDPNHPLAPRRDHAEPGLDGDFGNPVTIDIRGREIRKGRRVVDQHVPVPAWILVPGKLRRTLRETDYVRLPVVINIRHHHGIAAGYTRLDDVLTKAGRSVRIIRQNPNREEKQKSYTHDALISSQPYRRAQRGHLPRQPTECRPLFDGALCTDIGSLFLLVLADGVAQRVVRCNWNHERADFPVDLMAVNQRQIEVMLQSQPV